MSKTLEVILICFAAYKPLVIVDVGVKEMKTVESTLDSALLPPKPRKDYLPSKESAAV